MAKVKIKPIKKAAHNLIQDAGLSIDQKELDQTIDQVFEHMISLNLNPYDDWDGPRALHASATGEANLAALCEFGLRQNTMLWALNILCMLQTKTSQYVEYDTKSKKAVYSPAADLTRENIRVFLQAISDYWFFREPSAPGGLELLGESLHSLEPTETELNQTQAYIEQIAQTMYVPGILQSQKSWSQIGARDAYKHSIRRAGYVNGFHSKGLTKSDWDTIANYPWRILLQASLYRPLFDSDKDAFTRAMHDAISGYLEGSPTNEYVLLHEEHYPKHLKEDTEIFYHRDNKKLREKVLAISESSRV